MSRGGVNHRFEIYFAKRRVYVCSRRAYNTLGMVEVGAERESVCFANNDAQGRQNVLVVPEGLLPAARRNGSEGSAAAATSHVNAMTLRP